MKKTQKRVLDKKVKRSTLCKRKVVKKYRRLLKAGRITHSGIVQLKCGGCISEREALLINRIPVDHDEDVKVYSPLHETDGAGSKK